VKTQKEYRRNNVKPTKTSEFENLRKLDFLKFISSLRHLPQHRIALLKTALFSFGSLLDWTRQKGESARIGQHKRGAHLHDLHDLQHLKECWQICPFLKGRICTIYTL
jgi:hypothetical protein